MYISAQTVITAGAVVAALVSVITLIWKLFIWIERQKRQDEEIASIRAEFEHKISELKSVHCHDKDCIQEEQTLIIYGILACLKGLKEKGCNGPVTKTIEKIEKHLNLKAHGQGE